MGGCALVDAVHTERPSLEVIEGRDYAPATVEIALGLPQFDAVLPDGSLAAHASPEVWASQLAPVIAEGFTTIEVPSTWVPVGMLDHIRRAEFFEILSDAGLSAIALAVTRASVLEKGREQDNLVLHRRTIEAAGEAGIRFVSMGLHLPLSPRQREALWFWDEVERHDLNDPEAYARVVAVFQELGSLAAQCGVELSLEMYEDTFLGTADGAVQLIEDIGMESVGLNPDIGNLLRLNRDVDTWEYMLHRTLRHANYWHVKNYARVSGSTPGTYVTMPSTLETGIINYRKALPFAFAQGFAGPLVVEHYGGDGIGICATNRDYLRMLLR